MSTPMTQPEDAAARNALLAAAAEFAAAGCSVVPTRPDGSKAPAGKWQHWQHERPDGLQLADWFLRGDYDGFGIVTGRISGNLEMVELEGRAVNAGMLQRVKDLAHHTGLANVWDTVTNGYTEMTPSGGIHLLYRITDAPVPPNTKLARQPGEDIAVLAETRGEGGYVVVAPSGGRTHPTGNAWVRTTGHPSTIAALTIEQRDALLNCFRSLDEMPAPETVADELRVGPRTDGDVRPGDDYNAKTTWADLLAPLGWTQVYTANGVTYWRRPGKNIGISATTGRNDADNLYVFTTSTTFEAEKPYSKFTAYAHLEHHGDLSAAAKHLYADGYGTRRHLALVSDTLAAPAVQAATDEVEQLSDDEPSSWEPVNLDAIIDGTWIPPVADLLHREDGPGLLYSGRVHSLYGESESGKSWIAQLAVVRTMATGGNAVYIDFESEPGDLVHRLRLLGATNAQLRHQFTYIRPETMPTLADPAWQRLLFAPVDLVIIDGVTESLTMFGTESKDNDGITTWMRRFPRALARNTGAAVVLVDHVSKDKDRGRFAIGGQAKLASIDGAAYLVEPMTALAPGVKARITLRVTKDRPGAVRATAGLWRRADRTQEAAIIEFDATRRESISAVIAKPMDETEVVEIVASNLNRDIAFYLHEHPGAITRDVKKGVRGRDESIANALVAMQGKGQVEHDMGPNGKSMLWRLTFSGRDDFGLPQPPLGDLFGEVE